MKHASVRLPSHVRPQRYRLMIKPDLEHFTFQGEETIYFSLTKSTNSITLHAKELKIHQSIIKQDSKTIAPSKMSYDKKSETVTFSFKENLAKGKAELLIKFTGLINESMQGFYRSRYTHKGKQKYLATTQFEATDARRAFPCVDEPAAKAVFDITVMVPKGMVAISNTVQKDIVEEHEPGYHLVTFAPTPKMSTYLVAFIVGEFEYIEGKSKKGAIIRVFATPGKKHQAIFALEVGKQILSFFNDYFAIKYPLPVLDLIAIPDFESAAMENWGAVTFRESSLLLDEDNSSAATKQHIVEVIAHELAHQWFGNLVTMEWWTHLWLNEGFATYISYVAMHHLYPEWRVWTQFTHERLAVALSLDSLTASHPIEVPVHHPKEISEIFDQISYSKGASVIRMLASYVGEKDFQAGLRKYLKRHQYGNSLTDDLWQALEETSNKPVRKIMSVWTRKIGYPIVSTDLYHKQLGITQRRFLSNPTSARKERTHRTWPLPLVVQTFPKKQLHRLLIHKKAFQLAPVSAAQGLQLNTEAAGVFRTRYSPELLDLLGLQIQKQKLLPAERYQILNDQCAMAKAGQQQTIATLALLQQYQNETDFTVWTAIVSWLLEIRSVFIDSPWIRDFQQFAQDILRPISQQLTWEEKEKDDHVRILLRSLILHALGTFDHAPTIKKAHSLFKHFQKTNKGLSPNIRGMVYALAAEHGGIKEHAYFTELYKKSAFAEEKHRLAHALGLFKQPTLIEKTLAFSLSNAVRKQDAFRFLVITFANPYGREVSWQFLQRHWSTYLRYYQDGHLLSRIVSLASHCTSKRQLASLKQFFSKHQAQGAQRAVKQAIEKAETNVLWKTSQQKAIGEWLEKQRTAA
jgi:puromycin-sensitive aminopeptidase